MLRTFVLNDRTAADAMTPAPQVRSLRVDTTAGEASVQLPGSSHSRYPVIRLVTTGDSLEELVQEISDETNAVS